MSARHPFTSSFKFTQFLGIHSFGHSQNNLHTNCRVRVLCSPLVLLLFSRHRYACSRMYVCVQENDELKEAEIRIIREKV